MYPIPLPLPVPWGVGIFHAAAASLLGGVGEFIVIRFNGKVRTFILLSLFVT